MQARSFALWLRTGFALWVAIMVAGCAPVFSDLQSARLAGPGRVEITPGASTVYFDSTDESGHVQDHVGVQAATGMHERVDLRVRYERIDVGGSEPGINVVGFGPKVGLVKNRLAVAVPVGFAFGGGVDSGESWEAQPTLLGTLSAGRHTEFTAAAKYLIPLGAEDADNMVALNLGMGIGPAGQWLIRPEVGFLWDPGEEGTFVHLSLGFTFFVGARP